MKSFCYSYELKTLFKNFVFLILILFFCTAQMEKDETKSGISPNSCAKCSGIQTFSDHYILHVMELQAKITVA